MDSISLYERRLRMKDKTCLQMKKKKAFHPLAKLESNNEFKYLLINEIEKWMHGMYLKYISTSFPCRQKSHPPLAPSSNQKISTEKTKRIHLMNFRHRRPCRRRQTMGGNPVPHRKASEVFGYLKCRLTQWPLSKRECK